MITSINQPNKNLKYTSIMVKKLIKISEKKLDLILDIRYATKNNFTGRQIYNRDDCYLHPEAFERLTIAIEFAKKLGLKFKIFDGFRPSDSQKKLWNFYPNKNFISPPTKGSPHSRGIALDLTLIDKKGNDLDMGTEFDEFSTLSYHGTKYISKQATNNRLLLLGIMTSSGWDFFRNEWWHYQLFKSKSFPIMNDNILPEPLTKK
tara:strand:- start:13 stop:627 length:615 start_codon:yes stop_codon:yes gene_type:complete